jgi:hypothetical protein
MTYPVHVLGRDYNNSSMRCWLQITCTKELMPNHILHKYAPFRHSSRCIRAGKFHDKLPVSKRVPEVRKLRIVHLKRIKHARNCSHAIYIWWVSRLSGLSSLLSREPDTSQNKFALPSSPPLPAWSFHGSRLVRDQENHLSSLQVALR